MPRGLRVVGIDSQDYGPCMPSVLVSSLGKSSEKHGLLTLPWYEDGHNCFGDFEACSSGFVCDFTRSRIVSSCSTLQVAYLSFFSPVLTISSSDLPLPGTESVWRCFWTSASCTPYLSSRSQSTRTAPYWRSYAATDGLWLFRKLLLQG